MKDCMVDITDTQCKKVPHANRLHTLRHTKQFIHLLLFVALF